MGLTEERLQNIFQGFKIHFFDIDADKSGIVSQVSTGETPVEIDAIAVKDNLLFLINLYRGSRAQEIESKMAPFFRDMAYLTNFSQVNLNISNQTSKRGKANNITISSLRNSLSKSGFEIKIIKLFFAPNLDIPRDKISSLRRDEAVIDKKHFMYFEYALNNVGYPYLERELFYFFNINLREINLRKGSRAGNEPELTQDFPAIEIDLGSNLKMYSTCVSVNDIINYTQVIRIANDYNLAAFQRMINGSRIKNISKIYLHKHKSFPNNIILAFNPKFYNSGNISNFTSGSSENRKIKFYKEFGSLIIIDGQHRLLAHLLNPSRDINNNILANVILFLDNQKAYDEMSELFYTINTQQKRLTSLVSLKIRSRLEPFEIDSMWYLLFKYLNETRQEDNYLYNKICFDEPEMRVHDENKINITSIVNYAGIARTVNGCKIKKRRLLGLKDLGVSAIDGTYTLQKFCENFIRKYFSIIGDVLKENNIHLNARDLGGLLRLIIHFINDTNTKEVFKKLSEERGEISPRIKDEIKLYVKKIPFQRLNSLDYPSNAWAIMEGFFLGNMRKSMRGFGFQGLLSKKGIKGMKSGKKF